MAVELKRELKLLAKHSAVYSLGNFMQRIVALLLLPVYTSYLTPEDYGIKELVGLSADVIGILLAGAISGAFFRHYFKYESIEEKKQVVSTSLISVGAIGVVALIPLFLSSEFLSYRILNDAELSHYFLVSFSSLWFFSLNKIGFNYLKANQQSLKFISYSLVKMLLSIGLNIYFICYLKIGVFGILLSNLISVVVMSVIVVTPLLRQVGFGFSKVKFLEMLRFGSPLVPAQIGAFIVHLSDRFFLKEYCSMADVGLYSLGYRFGALPGTFIADPFNQIFQPRRLEIFNQEGSEEIFGKIITYFLFLMFLAGLLVSVLTRDLLIIMADSSFWSAYKITPIIALATIVFSLDYHLNVGLIMFNQTKYLAYVNLSNGLLVLALNYFLIPTYGIYGAAWATVIAFLYKSTMTYYFSSKFHKIKFEFIRIFKLIAVSGIVYSICLYNFSISVYLNFLLKFVFVLFSYVLLLFIFRFFTTSEIDKIFAIVRQKFAFR
jgi:O-antigen/teichoic acid export membrane protein